MSGQSTRKRRVVAGLWSAATLGVVVALAGAWFAHWRFHLVMTESMGTSVPRNSLAAVSPVDPRAVEVGDVISFRLRTSDVTDALHRVVRVVEQNGNRFYETQGDGNSAVDPRLVPTSDVIGRLRFSVAHVGAPLRALQGWPAVVVFTGVPLLALAVGEIRNRLRGTVIASHAETIVLRAVPGHPELWHAEISDAVDIRWTGQVRFRQRPVRRS